MLPDRPGIWLHIPTGQEIEIYDLEPVGTFCLWGSDYEGYAGDDIWLTDEWSGHLPAHRYDSDPASWALTEEHRRG